MIKQRKVLIFTLTALLGYGAFCAGYGIWWKNTQQNSVAPPIVTSATSSVPSSKTDEQPKNSETITHTPEPVSPPPQTPRPNSTSNVTSYPPITCTKTVIPRGETKVEYSSAYLKGDSRFYEGRDGYESICTGGRPGQAESLNYRSEPRSDYRIIGTGEYATPTKPTNYSQCDTISKNTSSYYLCLSLLSQQ